MSEIVIHGILDQPTATATGHGSRSLDGLLLALRGHNHHETRIELSFSTTSALLHLLSRTAAYCIDRVSYQGISVFEVLELWR
jgi:hypothetical protein